MRPREVDLSKHTELKQQSQGFHNWMDMWKNQVGRRKWWFCIWVTKVRVKEIKD